MTYHDDRAKIDSLEIEISLDVLRKGAAAYFEYDSETEEPEALVFKIADIVRRDIKRQFRLR